MEEFLGDTTKLPTVAFLKMIAFEGKKNIARSPESHGH